MRSVIDLIDLNLLRSTPPRSLPAHMLIALFRRRLWGLSKRLVLDPVLILGIGGMLMLVLYFGSIKGAVLLLLALGLRTWVRWRDGIRVFYEDVSLLRHGRVIRAYVLRSQTAHTLSGKACGVYLDCAIPVEERRTHIGSVWIADDNAGMELARRGRVQVLYLPTAPGSWRLLEGGYAETRSSGGLSAAQRDLMRE